MYTNRIELSNPIYESTLSFIAYSYRIVKVLICAHMHSMYPDFPAS